MTQKTKKPTIKQFATSSILVAAAVMMVVSAPISTFAAVDYSAQIQALQNEISGYQSQASNLRSQADTLQNTLNTIFAEKNALQAEISLNEAKVSQLTADIITNEAKLERQKKSISKTIAQIYINGTTSPIEMLASSKSVGEYVSEQEVRSSVRNQMKSSMDEVKRLRKELDAQKLDVERTLADQGARREVLASKEAEQANLVAQTRGEEAAYQNLIGNNNSEIANLQAQQAAANRSLGGQAVAGDPNMGGYPNNLRGPKDTSVDPWGMFNRECVSYTAWKVYQKNGYMPYWGGRGNANQWPSSAQADGIATGSEPRAHSVAISMNGYYGHAMWVEAVDGGKIIVSQMNYDLAGSYSEMTISGAGLIYIYF